MDKLVTKSKKTKISNLLKFENKYQEMMIKEAFDNLPSGICFFDELGIMIFCNLQMHNLSFAMMERDIQTIRDMQEMLLRPYYAKMDDGKYILANGEAYMFSQYDVSDEVGNHYKQFVATNVTEINEYQKKLNDSNQELLKLNEHLKELLSSVNDIVREEETLSVKIRIHDELGHNMLAARKLLFEKADVQRIKDECAAWRSTIDYLKHINYMTSKENSEENLEQYAMKVGVRLFIKGPFPKDDITKQVYCAAIKECITNCVRHASGDEVYVMLTERMLTISNNGVAPIGTIAESGGLHSLREKAEENGFSMVIKSKPSFFLIIEKNKKLY